ncbi:hypothetical protein D3C76_1719650 [compost metagenome]
MGHHVLDDAELIGKLSHLGDQLRNVLFRVDVEVLDHKAKRRAEFLSNRRKRQGPDLNRLTTARSIAHAPGDKLQSLKPC